MQKNIVHYFMLSVSPDPSSNASQHSHAVRTKALARQTVDEDIDDAVEEAHVLENQKGRHNVGVVGGLEEVYEHAAERVGFQRDVRQPEKEEEKGGDEQHPGHARLGRGLTPAPGALRPGRASCAASRLAWSTLQLLCWNLWPVSWWLTIGAVGGRCIHAHGARTS